MIYGVARVAPEKAVFRPALPMSFLPGISEMQMTDLAFKEQYRHPNWQRKRLEVMQRDEFVCQCCFSDETTLNVHHKRYIKGRMIWDYSNDLLVTLCGGCHESQHESSDGMKTVVSGLRVDGPGSLSDGLKLLAGWANEEIGFGFEAFLDDYSFMYHLGEVASLLSIWSAKKDGMTELRDLLAATPPQDRIPVIVAALRSHEPIKKTGFRGSL